MVYGYAGQVDGILGRLREELAEEASTIATGGYASAIVPFCDQVDEVDDLLTLTGLKLIWERNSDFLYRTPFVAHVSPPRCSSPRDGVGRHRARRVASARRIEGGQALRRAERVAVELDSRAFHDVPEAFERDRRARPEAGRPRLAAGPRHLAPAHA